MTDTVSEPKRYYHFLISGTILYAVPNPENPEEALPQSAPTNAILRSDTTDWPVYTLAKAQGNLHKSFISKIPEEGRPNILVADIVLNNITLIGYMSDAEFQAPDPAAAAAAQALASPMASAVAEEIEDRIG